MKKVFRSEDELWFVCLVFRLDEHSIGSGLSDDRLLDLVLFLNLNRMVVTSVPMAIDSSNRRVELKEEKLVNSVHSSVWYVYKQWYT